MDSPALGIDLRWLFLVFFVPLWSADRAPVLWPGAEESPHHANDSHRESEFHVTIAVLAAEDPANKGKNASGRRHDRLPPGIDGQRAAAVITVH